MRMAVHGRAGRRGGQMLLLTMAAGCTSPQSPDLPPGLAYTDCTYKSSTGRRESGLAAAPPGMGPVSVVPRKRTRAPTVAL